LWHVVVKTSDRRQRRSINSGRAGRIAAGKWHNKSGGAWSQLTVTMTCMSAGVAGFWSQPSELMIAHVR